MVIGRVARNQSTQVSIGIRGHSEVIGRAWSEGEAAAWNDNCGEAPADIVHVAGGVVTDLKRS